VLELTILFFIIKDSEAIILDNFCFVLESIVFVL